MLWAPRTHHAVLLYRMLGTRQNSSAAAPRRSPESCGTRNVPRNRAGKEQMLWAPRTHHAVLLYGMLGTRQNSSAAAPRRCSREWRDAENSAEPRGEASRRPWRPHDVCACRRAGGMTMRILPCGADATPRAVSGAAAPLCRGAAAEAWVRRFGALRAFLSLPASSPRRFAPAFIATRCSNGR